MGILKISVLTGLLWLPVMSGCSFSCSECNQASIDTLAHLITLSQSPRGDEEFRKAIQASPEPYQQKGAIVVCAENFSAKILQYSAKSSDDEKLADAIKALERQYNLNPGNDGKVSGDIIWLADELKWLASVMPDAAAGNFRPYENSGTGLRNFKREMSKGVNKMLGLLGVEEKSSDVATQMQPMNEQAISALGKILYKN